MENKQKNYRRFIGAIYVINIVTQAIVTLLTPVALFFIIAMLCVKNLAFPDWTYVIAISLGVIAGFLSMIKFVLTACANLDRLEKQNNDKDARK